MYKNINDYEQLYLIKENDDDARNLIFEKYKPIVLALAKKMFLENKQIELDDLIQEGYIGLNKAVNAFDENKNILFYTFSIICIQRQMKCLIKRHTTQKNYADNNSISLDLECDDTSLYNYINDERIGNNPIESAEISFYYAMLINFKNTLDPDLSQVFELRFNGFKYKEISNLLQIGVSSVDNYIHTIKERLKNYISYL